ncbi:flagellar motor protein MotB [Xylophilus rhododendri]|uniref:Flagellar motor protein MotB n=1 Tax=Xylophilus rhododendri TaxID=2697032 RepID=A0A857J536_9BURK|nr:flagellar motor protein MotB [Xylophilus rhododendri]QHI97968.1 flagellar motor protein MotB [Xylophilus rhododendri]
MAEKKLQPIIVKKIKKGGHAPHGGAWKIAYADFVTAMMAFFLLMWLLGSTAKGELQGIASYFSNPMQVALGGGDGSGNSSSILPGGGNDLTKVHGQVRRSESDEDKKVKMSARMERRRQAQQDAQRMAELQNKIESLITESPKLREYKSQIKIEVTPDGLQIQIVDDQNRPMFDSGSALVKPYMRDILREIGAALGNVENKISLAGHTDATPYGNGERGYSNWELSSDRAAATRRELVGAGMPDAQLARVVGLAASDPFDKNDPKAPANRRITVTVLTREAEQRLLGHGLPAVPPEDLTDAVEGMDAADGKGGNGATTTPAAASTNNNNGAQALPLRKPMIDLPARPPRNQAEAPAAR